MAKAGRPTDFGEHMPGLVKEYLSTYETMIPTKAGLSLHLGVCKATVEKWLKLDQEDENVSQFVGLVNDLMSLQELKLLDNGLKGDYNASITKLLLTKHGYHDKQAQEVSGPGGKPVEVDQHWQVEFVNAPPESK